MVGRMDISRCDDCCGCAISAENTVKCTEEWSGTFGHSTSGAMQIRHFANALRGALNDPWKVEFQVDSQVGSQVNYPQSLRILGGMLDCDHFLFGEIVQLSATEAYSRIGQREAGVDTYFARQPFTGADGPSIWPGGTGNRSKIFTLYWDGELAMFDIPSIRLGTRNVTPFGRLAGFGTGEGNVHSFSFGGGGVLGATALFSAAAPSCPASPFQCADGNVPAVLQVEIPGCSGTYLGGPCLTASTYTFPLGVTNAGGPADAGAGDGGDSAGSCRWGRQAHPTDPNQDVIVSLSVDGDGQRLLTISCRHIGFNVYLATFVLANPPVPAITEWVNWIEVPFGFGQASCGVCGTARVRIA